MSFHQFVNQRHKRKLSIVQKQLASKIHFIFHCLTCWIEFEALHYKCHRCFLLDTINKTLSDLKISRILKWVKCRHHIWYSRVVGNTFWSIESSRTKPLIKDFHFYWVSSNKITKHFYSIILCINLRAKWIIVSLKRGQKLFRSRFHPRHVKYENGWTWEVRFLIQQQILLQNFIIFPFFSKSLSGFS